MPSVINYPSELPAPLKNSYSETIPSGVIRSSMDMGQDKVRRKISRAVKYIDVSFRMTAEQKEIFEDFYNNTLQGGVRFFNWRNKVVRFVESDNQLSTWKMLDSKGKYWEISITMEEEI